MQGSFIGHYLTEPAATPVGLRLDITPGPVTTTRSNFTGTATLGAEEYTVEGFEATNMNLEFLTPQALAPMSDMVMTLKDSSGAVVYSLCSRVRYDSDQADSRYSFDGAALYTGECGSGSSVYDENVFAEVYLEKQRL